MPLYVGAKPEFQGDISIGWAGRWIEVDLRQYHRSLRRPAANTSPGVEYTSSELSAEWQ